MQRTRIKVCGVRDAQTARVAAEAGADAVGLVFATGSVRRVTVEAARAVAAALPAFVEPVGLFVDEPVQSVAATAEAVGLRTVQLHGREGPEDVQALAPLRVIKALPFCLDEAAGPWEQWRDSGVAGLLWDVAAPAGGGVGGGTGRVLDWAAVAAVMQGLGSAKGPAMILAGGLTPQNVAEAIREASPYAVDVSSGVESARGVKDAGRVRAFCRAVHGADRR